MAILNLKILAKKPEWKKLNPSARVLLQTITTVSDKNGFTSYPGRFFMETSGIGSWETFQKAKKELEKSGLIKIEKYWTLLKHCNKIVPRSYLTYQITEDVVWKTDSNNLPLESDSQTTATEISAARAVADKHVEEWTELAAKTFDFAATAQERFERGSPDEKKTILRVVGSNLILKDKKLEVKPRNPFLLIREALSEVNHPKRIEPEEKIDSRLRIDDLRLQNPVWV